MDERDAFRGRQGDHRAPQVRSFPDPPVVAAPGSRQQAQCREDDHQHVAGEVIAVHKWAEDRPVLERLEEAVDALRADRGLKKGDRGEREAE
jgi:hypothetical protein